MDMDDFNYSISQLKAIETCLVDISLMLCNETDETHRGEAIYFLSNMLFDIINKLETIKEIQ